MMKKNIKVLNIAIFSVCMLLTVLFVTLTIVSSVTAKAQMSQRAADIWSGKSGRKYSQVSVFFTENAGFSSLHIRSVRDAIEKGFSTLPGEYFGEGEQTIAKEDIWLDAYSAEFSLNAETDKKSVNVTAAAVGGEFFFFRQFKFIYGSGFVDNELVFDKIVLDSDAAWQLFGSSDIVGLTVKIQGYPFVVSGVVDKNADDVSKELYGLTPRVYIPITAYLKYIATSDSVDLSSYEAVIPNPLEDYAYASIESGISVSEESRVIVDNTARFTIPALWGTFKSLATRSVRTSQITYPYWENAAAVKTDKLAVLMVVRMTCIIIVILTALTYVTLGLVKLVSKIKRKKYRYL